MQRALALLTLFSSSVSVVDAVAHKYKAGDPIDLWVNKVRHNSFVLLILKEFQKLLFVYG